jgi:DNA recombination protein RmuC
MYLIVLALVFVLLAVIAAAGFVAFKARDNSDRRSEITAVLNEKFIEFSRDIREAMDNARREMAGSKDAISENGRRTLEHINNVNQTVRDLVLQQEKAEKLGQSLEYLLQAPKLRGNYGETILEEMLERVLPSKGMWERQYSIDGTEKVDAVVKYRDVVIPIDSKFPRDDYQKYISSSDAASRKAHWSNYEKALKVQINSISEKYVKPEKGTSEFALLFIPSEAIYYETIAERNYIDEPCLIYEYARDRKVVPVSPNTFYAFLQVIIMGVRNIEVAKEAKKLQESLAKIEKDFELFYKKFELIGRSLENASGAYSTGENHAKRFKKDLGAAINMDGVLTESVEKGFAGVSGEVPEKRDR